MSFPTPIPEDLAELIAERLRVIGDPTRIRLLDAMRDGERTVGSLAGSLELTQQNASKHLAVMHRAGIVGRRKEGTCVLYRVTDASIYDLCEQVCGGLQQQLDQLNSVMEATR
ncbi:MAG: metalloregulator ArsR/SmtB family transcription factor [Baekduia sp.]